jgi:mRNA interferase RelE/StbE
MTYEIEFSRLAIKYLESLDQKLRNRILDHLNILSEDPRKNELDIKKLQGYPGLYRLRIGSYRIIYSIHDEILIIHVVRIGSRGDVYK